MDEKFQLAELVPVNNISVTRKRLREKEEWDRLKAPLFASSEANLPNMTGPSL